MFRHYGLAIALLLSSNCAQAIQYDSSSARDVFQNSLTGFAIDSYHAGNWHLSIAFSRPIVDLLSYTQQDLISRAYRTDLGDYLKDRDYISLNNDYTIVDSTHAFIDLSMYQADRGRIYSLPEYAITEYAGFELEARDANGKVVPYTAISSGEATVPEPSAWAMLVIGFGLVSRATRHKPVLGAR